MLPRKNVQCPASADCIVTRGQHRCGVVEVLLAPALDKLLELRDQAAAGDLKIAGLNVVNTVLYRTGKYDRIYPPSEDFLFPDEGIRFYFSEDRLNNLTVRPSGTGNSLRFHVQLHSPVDEANLIAKKADLRAQAQALADAIRDLLGAPR